MTPEGEPPLLRDTRVWVRWVGRDAALPTPVRHRVEEALAEHRLWISVISAGEVALLVKHGRLHLGRPMREWIARAESLRGLRFLPVDVGLVVRSVELANLDADPADRLIVASAERVRAVLVTRDQRLRAYPGLPTIWGEGGDLRRSGG